MGHDSTQRARCYSPDCIEWSTWTSWSNCNAQRERQCRLKGTTKIAKGCSGKSIEKERCNDCKAIWTEWSSWGGCSATCGSSHQVRKRVCVLQYTVHPSNKCNGKSTEVKVCSDPACPTWASWNNWSACTKSCGTDSTRTRSRKCIFNGNPIASTSCSPGGPSETVNCNKAGCPVWTTWGAWGSCSATCGSGINRNRHRQCVISGTTQLTTGCSGSATSVGQCTWLKGCPVWTSWGTWGPCSASCGTTGVTRTRHRQCVHQGTTTSTSGCLGLTSNVTPCPARLCKYIVYIFYMYTICLIIQSRSFYYIYSLYMPLECADLEARRYHRGSIMLFPFIEKYAFLPF